VTFKINYLADVKNVCFFISETDHCHGQPHDVCRDDTANPKKFKPQLLAA